jgi:hypothetical protein
MSEYRISLLFLGYGIPLSQDQEVRMRAQRLSAKRPEFYRWEENILWCQTTDISEGSLFSAVYSWVLTGKGQEPV